MPKTEGMTDREILKEYGQRCYTAFEDPSQALTQLRAYYREKIKRALPKKRVYLEENEKLTGITKTEKEKVLHGIYNFNTAIDAILKEIDKEMR